MGRYTVCRPSGLHYFPSWGCRVVGGRGVPQPQQPQSLRDQVSRVAPEKQFRARAPESGQSWGECQGGAAVRVVIMQAELREVGGHILLGQELLALGLPRVQASRQPRVALGPTRGATLQGLLKDHWSLGSGGRGWDAGSRGGAPGAWPHAGGVALGALSSEIPRGAEDGWRAAGRRVCSAGWGRGSGVAGRRWAPLSVGGPGGLRGVHLCSWGSGGTRRPPAGRACRRYWTSGTPGR